MGLALPGALLVHAPPGGLDVGVLEVTHADDAGRPHQHRALVGVEVHVVDGFALELDQAGVVEVDVAPGHVAQQAGHVGEHADAPASRVGDLAAALAGGASGGEAHLAVADLAVDVTARLARQALPLSLAAATALVAGRRQVDVVPRLRPLVRVLQEVARVGALVVQAVVPQCSADVAAGTPDTSKTQKSCRMTGTLTL